MCLIFLALEAHPRFPIVIAANRDEFYDRPTAPAAFWSDAPEVLAGRDLQAGGTWLGITRTGRTAALTNYRDPGSNKQDAPSRGKLVSDFLANNAAPSVFLERLSKDAARHNGFNILVGQGKSFYWYSNRGDRVRKLPAGVHGLSNHLLDTPWPKVEKGKRDLAGILLEEDISVEKVLQMLLDQNAVPDGSLPDTGVGVEWERILSPIFISSPNYGTRSSTAILVNSLGMATFAERTFEKGAERYSTTMYTLPFSLDVLP